MGYRPNPFAYTLKTNRSFMVGVLVPDLVNPIFPPMIRGLESVLEPAGYTTWVGNTDNKGARERMILEQMRTRQVDGLILATAKRRDAVVEEPRAARMPFVLINRTVAARSVHALVNEDRAGMRMAVEHVVSLGHRHIAHLAGPQRLSTGFQRQRGFREALRNLGLEPAPGTIVPCGAYTQAEGRRALLELLGERTRITAVVAANDMLAVGCYDALSERGLRCPDDISVTGFNDMPFMDKLRPPLTTIGSALHEIGCPRGPDAAGAGSGVAVQPARGIAAGLAGGARLDGAGARGSPLEYPGRDKRTARNGPLKRRTRPSKRSCLRSRAGCRLASRGVAESIDEVGPQPVAMPHVRQREGRLWKMRRSGKAGIGRAISVTTTGRPIVVQRAFVKTTEQTPRAALDSVHGCSVAVPS
jgi:LacI family transcriptional regulator